MKKSIFKLSIVTIVICTIIITHYTTKNNILLVNKNNPLEKTFEPNNLVVSNYSVDKVVYLEEVAAKQLEKMVEDAKKEGINLLLISGYRSYDYQVRVYNNSIKNNGKEYTDKYVAIPGQSEHQTGLAMDITSMNHSNLNESFSETKEAKWLHENMYDYGFILRYPKGKEDITGYNYEPWHIRYVGKSASKEIQKTGQTLEEYLFEYRHT